MAADNPIPVTAYSYIRFSSKKQEEGDSLRRQTEQAAAYALRRGWRLDTALNLRDLGVSAFRGTNALTGNLGAFLTEIKRGTVKPGSVLIVESFDRISRQGIDEGYDVVKGILKAGVRIVTLSPEREFDSSATKSLSRGALEIQLILERAAEESERKSERVGAARSQERRKIRETGEIATLQLPKWIQAVNGHLQLIPEAAEAVQQVFQLSANGYGAAAIVKRLTADGVAPIGRSGKWTRPYVGLLLRDRRVLGEYQPHKGKDKDGDIVTGYYPAVITEEMWYQSRAGVGQRKRHPGQNGHSDRVNLFAGILKHARDGDNYLMTQRFSRNRAGEKTRQFTVLVNYLGDQGHSKAYSIPYDGFEDAILSRLREIDPHEILNGDSPPDDSTILAGQLAGVEAELIEATAFMESNGFSPAIGKRIQTLESKKGELATALSDARAKAAHPLSESWGEAQSLTKILKEATDKQETRLRLRSALRRMVEVIYILVVPRSHREQFCLVQMDFVGGKRRHYLIYHKTAGNRQPEQWEVQSWFRGPEPLEQGEVDLVKDWQMIEATILGN